MYNTVLERVADVTAINEELKRCNMADWKLVAIMPKPVSNSVGGGQPSVFLFFECPGNPPA